MRLNEHTLYYALQSWDNPKKFKDNREKGRILGYMEANLVELGIIKIGEPFPYKHIKGEKVEDYEEMILRLANKHNVKPLNKQRDENTDKHRRRIG